MKTQKLKVIDILVTDLKEYEFNTKKHPEWQVNQIIDSIREFGFCDPIAIDENNVIIEGHGRLLALKKLGREKVPCIRLDHLNENQKRAYILAHNKLTMNTGFDEELLKQELEKLNIEEFDLTKLGFTESELKIITGNLENDEDVSSLSNSSKKVEFEVKEKKNGYICPHCGEKHLKEEFEEVNI